MHKNKTVNINIAWHNLSFLTFLYEYLGVEIIWGVTFVHSFSTRRLTSAMEEHVKELDARRLFKIAQTFSMILRSGLYGGQSSVSTLSWFSHEVTFEARWIGALSCCSTKSKSERANTDDLLRTSIYSTEFILRIRSKIEYVLKRLYLLMNHVFRWVDRTNLWLGSLKMK